jgi:hypothetical protein
VPCHRKPQAAWCTIPNLVTPQLARPNNQGRSATTGATTATSPRRLTPIALIHLFLHLNSSTIQLLHGCDSQHGGAECLNRG